MAAIIERLRRMAFRHHRCNRRAIERHCKHRREQAQTRAAGSFHNWVTPVCGKVHSGSSGTPAQSPYAARMARLCIKGAADTRTSGQEESIASTFGATSAGTRTKGHAAATSYGATATNAEYSAQQSTASLRDDGTNSDAANYYGHGNEGTAHPSTKRWQLLFLNHRLSGNRTTMPRAYDHANQAS